MRHSAGYVGDGGVSRELDDVTSDEVERRFRLSPLRNSLMATGLPVRRAVYVAFAIKATRAML